MIKLIIMTLFSSNPNHKTIKGATATIGTVCKSIAYGYRLFSNILDKLIIVAIKTPINMAII